MTDGRRKIPRLRRSLPPFQFVHGLLHFVQGHFQRFCEMVQQFLQFVQQVLGLLHQFAGQDVPVLHHFLE